MSDQAASLQELLAAALRSAADVAQSRVGKGVSIVAGQAPDSTALLRFDVKFDETASLSWFVSNEDATGFSDMLIGGVGDRGAVLTEMHLDALSGVFSDMLERAVEGLCSGLTQQLAAGGVDMGMESAIPDIESGGSGIVLALDIEGFGPLTVVEHANAALVTLLQRYLPVDGVATGIDPSAIAEPAAPAAAAAAPAAEAPANDSDNVVQLPNLGERGAAGIQRDLRMLLNVPLNVTVELGRTERTVRDLLELNVGSILELSKLAGDPMDIMVNGKVLARGEVVVIDEEFGVRVTEILDPEQRLRNLG